VQTCFHTVDTSFFVFRLAAPQVLTPLQCVAAAKWSIAQQKVDTMSVISPIQLVNSRIEPTAIFFLKVHTAQQKLTAVEIRLKGTVSKELLICFLVLKAKSIPF
jgi:hypothetical protein